MSKPTMTPEEIAEWKASCPFEKLNETVSGHIFDRYVTAESGDKESLHLPKNIAKSATT